MQAAATGDPGETSLGRRRFRYNRSKEIPMHNSWMHLWLSAANSWAGVMRDLWTASPESCANLFVLGQSNARE
jgi:hypothetical protein